MRIVVVSDTHGNSLRLKMIVEKHLNDTDLFIHLGDGLREFGNIKALYPEKEFAGVHGNCDFGVDEESSKIITCDKTRIFACHGDILSVKSGLKRLKQVARQNNASIALYGHTHKNSTEYAKGMYIMNPGSLTQPRDSKSSYGIIDITKSGIVLNIVEVLQ